MSQPPPKDDFLEAEVQRALAPYRGRVSAQELAALEEVVRDTLANDPVAVNLLRAARPRAVPQQSDQVPVFQDTGPPKPAIKRSGEK
ncbi:MAG: hypothetical protein IPK82_44065 [Polyangiaceae bacterium]|nr:hypothetical protein [Polyangiaceae bacterium]